jgi:hypothetical protein
VAAVGLHDVHHDAEEGVKRAHHLARRPLPGQRGGADKVDEQGRDLSFLALRRDVSVEHRACNVTAHVATEEVVQALALGQYQGGETGDADERLREQQLLVRWPAPRTDRRRVP